MVLTPLSEFYPPQLRNIADPPKVLYWQGQLSLRKMKELWQRPLLAVVGSRQMSPYGKEVTEKLVEALVKRGVVIVSGLARGIDTVAHWTAIKNKGTTVAVLGCGLDVVYPPENKKLWEQVDLLLSEFAAGTKPLAKNFPRRNRIIAGLVRAVLVVEAAERSGSLITARLAAEEGREVLAVPGKITGGLSWGTNFLIAQGAKPVLDVEDVLEELF